MSLYYTFDIILGIPFKKELLNNLLNRGQNLGFIYLDKQNFNLGTSKQISIEEAVNNIIDSKKNSEDNLSQSKSLIVQVENSYFTFAIYEKNNSFKIHIFPIGNIWKKVFNGESYVDISRYTKLLIDLCEDFPVIKICTETD